MQHIIQHRQVNLKLTSDPGESKTVTYAGPEREQWIEAIKKKITIFMSIGAWKPVSRNKVVEDKKRNIISTKWIFKKKTEQDNSSKSNINRFHANTRS
jgi:hypothetical protein